MTRRDDRPTLWSDGLATLFARSDKLRHQRAARKVRMARKRRRGFEGTTDLYPLEARLRFTMDGGRPSFGFVLVNKEAVLEHALAELRKQVADGAGIPVFVGSAH